MSQKRAFLIVGNSREYYLNIKEFDEYLQSKGIPTEVFEGAYKTGDECTEKLRNFSRYPMDTAIVAFNGHGNDGSWELNEGDYLRFDELYSALGIGNDSLSRQFIFLADCCHATSIKAGLWRNGVLPNRAL